MFYFKYFLIHWIMYRLKEYQSCDNRKAIKKHKNKIITIKGGIIYMTKLHIILDAGHGGTDGGASGNGIIEKNMTLQISQYQKTRFEAHGIKVSMTRTTDKTLSSTVRSGIVKNSGAKYCFSNHINAGGNTATGAECIYSIYSTSALSDAIGQEFKALGHKYRKSYTKTLPQSAKSDYYFMHRLTGAVNTVIVEYGFLSNKKEADYLQKNWKMLAEAAVKAFVTYVGLKYVAPVSSTVPQPAKSTHIGVATIICDELNVRQAASFDAPIVKVVKKWEAYKVYERDAKTGMYRVGTNAWISGGTKYVTYKAV